MPLIAYLFLTLMVIFIPSWLFWLAAIVAILLVTVVVSEFGGSVGLQAGMIVAFYVFVVFVIRFAIHHVTWHWG